MEENYYPKISEINKQLLESMSVMANCMKEALGSPAEIAVMISSLKDSLLLISKEMIECLPSEQMIAENIRNLMGQIIGLYSISLIDAPAISVPEETIAPIREMALFVPEENREEFQKIVAPDSTGKNKIISTENIKWLIATIISVIAILVSLKTQTIDEETKQILRNRNEIEEDKLEVMESGLTAINNLLEYLQEAGVDIRKDSLSITEQTDLISQDSEHTTDAQNPKDQDDDT